MNKSEPSVGGAADAGNKGVTACVLVGLTEADDDESDAVEGERWFPGTQGVGNNLEGCAGGE